MGPKVVRSTVLTTEEARGRRFPQAYAAEAVPHRIHTVLTDNGVQFGDAIQHHSGPTARYRIHMFDRVCLEHGIERRFTKPNHP